MGIIKKSIFHPVKKFFKVEKGFAPYRDRFLTGFTLMEVITTTVIVSFGFALLMRVLSMAMSADKYLEYRITALNLANEKMEQIKNTSFNSINPGSESAATVGFPFIDERRTTVTLVDQYLKDVVVEVYWTQKGAQNKVRLETLICDY